MTKCNTFQIEKAKISSFLAFAKDFILQTEWRILLPLLGFQFILEFSHKTKIAMDLHRVAGLHLAALISATEF